MFLGRGLPPFWLISSSTVPRRAQRTLCGFQRFSWDFHKPEIVFEIGSHRWYLKVATTMTNVQASSWGGHGSSARLTTVHFNSQKRLCFLHLPLNRAKTLDEDRRKNWIWNSLRKKLFSHFSVFVTRLHARLLSWISKGLCRVARFLLFMFVFFEWWRFPIVKLETVCGDH